MDVDNIALGRDFRQILLERLDTCNVVLVLIGPNWLEARDASGNRRLESPTDFVRQEIATSLKRNIAVTPVLLQGASMPLPERLPEDLKDLAYRNGFELSHIRWESDVRELIRRLGLITGQTEQFPSLTPNALAASKPGHSPASAGPSAKRAPLLPWIAAG